MRFYCYRKSAFHAFSEPQLAGAEKAGLIVFGRQIFTQEAVLSDQWTYLRLTMDAHQRGQFYTSPDGKKWTPTGPLFQAEKGYWTGAQIGLFCTRNKTINDSGWMDVDWFEIQITPSNGQ